LTGVQGLRRVADFHYRKMRSLGGVPPFEHEQVGNIAFALKLTEWTFRLLPSPDFPPFWSSVFYLNLWSSFWGPL
jgi:hypothetical protein